MDFLEEVWSDSVEARVSHGCEGYSWKVREVKADDPDSCGN